MTGAEARDRVEEIEVGLLLEAIRQRYHYDFRGYSRSSIVRRLAAARAHFRVSSLSALQDRLLREPALLPELLNFLTIQVSELFRDPPYYRALRETVIPHLATYPSLKVWVAGCGDGEELYSMAILFREEGLEQRTVFYATDINPAALRRAETGIYPVERLPGFSENYQRGGGRFSLADYYTAAYGAAAFDKSLRARTVFANHSLVSDAAFAEVHLISCRNVLIYFDRPLQERAVELFRESLVHGGFLGLGDKETLRFTRHAGDFAPFAEVERVYRRSVPAAAAREPGHV